ncbi:universal stress protein [Natronorubrum sp. JWXQ-INN-674]|uniref:Universal stress protein n=1 Tax=Natronorubrum halalkaliphilum TaxID=2691917 RepID=A0A6B0VRK9_9EURY|nr:universal stress protein [Natronorubrum halalkaliphilum]MXV64074.1 universal stress protein [Natronorubrum halalkaliphilum]
MTFVVPFDGSALAEAALVRAVEYGQALDEDVTAVAVVPERKRYAREKGWIGAEESYDVESVVERLRGQVTNLAPNASFEYECIREFPPEARLAGHIERLILEHDPSTVFLGSDNVGRVVTPLTSVGVHLADEEAYDVMIIRQRAPPKLAALEAHDEFYDDTSE